MSVLLLVLLELVRQLPDGRDHWKITEFTVWALEKGCIYLKNNQHLDNIV